MDEFDDIKKRKFNISVWMISTIVIALLLIISVFTHGFGIKSITGATSFDIENQVKDYIEKNLVNPETKVVVSDLQEENGIYKVSIEVSGQKFDSYVSQDGKLLFPTVIDMTKEILPLQQEVSPQQKIVDVSADDDAVKGAKNALVTIIEFSDYDCPFCGRHFRETLPQIIKEYVDTGKVKLVFRDFPLSFHENAQKAAEAAECAGEQEKYWEMHDKLFENQDALDVSSLKTYSQQIGLNTREFNKCLDSGEMADEIKKDISDGESAGVSGTPAFFINGRFLSGAQPFSAFKQIIDEELAK